MNNFFKGLAALLTVAVVAGMVYAVGFNGTVINAPGLTYSNRYVFDLVNLDVNTISATAVYSSGTYATGTFGTGSTSAGSMLVVSNSALAAASATTSLTVTSTSGALGDSIVIPALTKPGAIVLTAGRDWNYGATVALTAASINTALNQVTWLSHNVVGAVIYSTAPAGTRYNGISVTTNNSGTITISSPTLVGGVDPITVYVNGTALKAGRDFTVGASAALTATAIKNAINANSRLAAYLTADTATSSVTLVSDKVGTVSNFALGTSNTAGITVSGVAMTGGTAGSWTLSSKNITIASHALPLGLPVLYRLGSGSPAIGGLTGETTYYAIPVDANTIQLASSQDNAVLGTGITLTSTSTLAAAKSYTLIPLAFASGASTGAKWQVSNNSTDWTDVSATTVSWISGGGAGSTSWDLGRINYRYLGFNIVKPTTGAVNWTVTGTGTYQY